MCCHNLLSLLGHHRDTAEIRNNPLRNQTSASEFSSAGSGVKVVIWLYPKLTAQIKFHKPGRHYQDKVNAAWRTVPSGVVGCTASSSTTPGKENILHLFPRLTSGLGTSLQYPFHGYPCVSQPPFFMSWQLPRFGQDQKHTKLRWDFGSATCVPGSSALVFWSVFLLREERQDGEKKSMSSFSPLCRPASFSSIFAIFLLHLNHLFLTSKSSGKFTLLKENPQKNNQLNSHSL